MGADRKESTSRREKKGKKTTEREREMFIIRDTTNKEGNNRCKIKRNNHLSKSIHSVRGR